MKTDTIFYSLFQEFPRFFFELINCSSEQATVYKFTSREIKQLAFRIDGLFLPTIEDSVKPFSLPDAAVQRDLINLIETIIVYKLPQKSHEEIAAMLNLTEELKQSRFYQEGFEKDKVKPS